MEKALNVMYALREAVSLSKNYPSDEILDEAIAELEEAMKPKTCEWKQYDTEYYTEYDTHWDGSCGIYWMLEEGTPSYNGMKFCPKCGGKLIEIDPKDNA